jgi:DNA (cytosine-5)-methyltransferase 1
MDKLFFLDLFAGAGGLSEGFIRAGFTPIAHLEQDKAACNTLLTRMAYHWLKNTGLHNIYIEYLLGEKNREEFYGIIPDQIKDSIINLEINDQTLQTAFNKVQNLLTAKNISVDVIVGGPPCQGFSLVGRSRNEKGMTDDKRNYLYKFYAKFLRQYQPKCFVFENVIGLLSAKDLDGKLHIEKMKKEFNNSGYDVAVKALNMSEFGIPQTRKRVIIFGSLKELNLQFPELEKETVYGMVADLINQLPSLKAGEGYPKTILEDNSNTYLEQLKIKSPGIPITLHSARPNNKRDLEIYKITAEKWNKNKERLNYSDLPENLKTHKNKEDFTDRYKVVAADIPYSHTILAHLAKDGHFFIHPDIDQNRSITPREAARLQTFPDDYYFESLSEKPSRSAVFKQIGNAVPPLFAEKLAIKIKDLVNGK